jgi:hypothetical protein
LEPYQDADHRVTASLQLNHPNDNAEHLRFGAEYAWREMFLVRFGWKRTIGQPVLSEDGTSEEGLAAGAGVRVLLLGHTIAADYAFVDFRRLGAIHRISMAFTW